MKQLIGVLAMLMFINNVKAQEGKRAVLHFSDLKQFEGAWSGDLCYKDYQSGKMQRIQASIKIKWQTGRTWIVEYDYPREPGHKSTDVYTLNTHGDSLSNTRIIEKKRLHPGGISFTTESKGKDGNDDQQALFHYIWRMEGDSLQIAKMVRYAHTDTFFLRNTYLLKLVKGR
ncbi:MAG: hypothetical protein J0I41_11020 [Filimonas sp.]|nr:hypothetical protein [Filimonas sp.]